MQALSIICAGTALASMAAIMIHDHARARAKQKEEDQERYWREMCHQIEDAPDLPLNWRLYDAE